jgi:hypothetical protein
MDPGVVAPAALDLRQRLLPGPAGLAQVAHAGQRLEEPGPWRNGAQGTVERLPDRARGERRGDEGSRPQLAVDAVRDM